MHRTLLATTFWLAGCGGGPARTVDSGAPFPPLGECEFDLGLWCFNAEGAGGPTSTTGTCPTTTAEEQMADPRTWHARCEDPVHGTLDLVTRQSGFGGPSWYFDRHGDLVAFVYDTDVNVFCGGRSFSAVYGFEPECTTLCLVEGPEDTDSTLGVPPPCDGR